ncbi:hypothetical protein HG530_007143 [Fusarium avenaceum]|nr:hypothetical protein HG530_007143 [Fusarium avenaceum]
MAAKIIEPIQCMGGPWIVHANPMRPIGKQGARVILTLLDVLLDSRDEHQPSQKISDTNGAEGKANLNSVKVPLAIDQSKGLDEHEDQSVGETRKKRQDQNDRLGEEHLEGTGPCDEDLLGGETLSEGNKLIGTPDVGVCLLSALLGNAVHENGASRLGHSQEMDDLDEATEDKLDPDGPAPVEVLLSETTDDRAQNGTTDGGKDDNEKDHGTTARSLGTNIELLRNTRDGIGVERGVEVHGDLHPEDDGEDVPLLPLRVRVAQLIVAVVLCDFVFVVGTQLLQASAVTVADVAGAVGALIAAVLVVSGAVEILLQTRVCDVQIIMVDDLRGVF